VAACASDVGARLIAPGVSSPQQLHELQNLGIELVQGPIVGEPIPLSELGDRPTMWEGSSIKLSSPEADNEGEQVPPSSTSTPGGGAS
jgi:hypothetical protein